MSLNLFSNKSLYHSPDDKPQNDSKNHCYQQNEQEADPYIVTFLAFSEIILQCQLSINIFADFAKNPFVSFLALTFESPLARIDIALAFIDVQAFVVRSPEARVKGNVSSSFWKRKFFFFSLGLIILKWHEYVIYKTIFYLGFIIRNFILNESIFL